MLLPFHHRQGKRIRIGISLTSRTLKADPKGLYDPDSSFVVRAGDRFWCSRCVDIERTDNVRAGSGLALHWGSKGDGHDGADDVG